MAHTAQYGRQLRLPYIFLLWMYVATQYTKTGLLYMYLLYYQRAPEYAIQAGDKITRLASSVQDRYISLKLYSLMLLLWTYLLDNYYYERNAP